MSDELVERVRHAICEAQARWTGGAGTTQEDIDIRLAMPSSRYLAEAAAAVKIEELEGRLKRIAEGDVPRPLGKRWRKDGEPSKHDQCVHGLWMYEDCGQCLSDFAAGG